MTEPRTEAGRALLKREDYNERSFPLITAEMVCAVETEASRLDIDRLAKVMEAHAWDIDCGGHCAAELARRYESGDVQ